MQLDILFHSFSILLSSNPLTAGQALGTDSFYVSFNGQTHCTEIHF